MSNTPDIGPAPEKKPPAVSFIFRHSRRPYPDFQASEDECGTVTRYLSGERFDPDQVEKKLFENLCNRATQKLVWIVVTVTAPEKKVATYTVVHAANDKLHLRLLTGHHAVSEPKADQPEAEASIAERSTKTSVLGFHRRFADDLAIRSARREAAFEEVQPGRIFADKVVAVNDGRKLGGLLGEVIAKAKLNEYGPEERSATRDAARFDATLQAYEIVEGVPVKHWSRIPLQAAQLAPSSRQILEAGDKWPHHGRPYFIDLVVAGEVNATEGKVTGIGGRGTRWKFEMAGAVARFGHDNSGPYLVLATYGENPAARNTCGFLRAYAHPIVSRTCWLLVDSTNERRVALVLMRLVDACRARGLPVYFSKPLLCLVLADGQGVNHRICPDFIVAYEGRESRLNIEVLGSRRADYVADKAEHKAILELHGIYHEVDAVLAAQSAGGWQVQEDRLRAAFYAWLSAVRQRGTTNP